jgi:hypothetical protein
MESTSPDRATCLSHDAVSGVDGYTEIRGWRKIRPRGDICPPSVGTAPWPGGGHSPTSSVVTNRLDATGVTWAGCTSCDRPLYLREGDALCLAGRSTKAPVPDPNVHDAHLASECLTRAERDG